MASESAVRYYARTHTVAELEILCRAAAEAIETSAVTTRSIQGQSVTISPERADELLDLYDSAREARALLDSSDNSTTVSVARTMAVPFDFSGRCIE